MPERISIPYHAEISPGDEGTVSIYQVPGARKLRIIRTNIHFPKDQAGELHLALYHGIRKVLPTVRDYTGDDTRLTDNTPAEWGPGDEVLLWYKNDNDVYSRESYITLEGELV